MGGGCHFINSPLASSSNFILHIWNLAKHHHVMEDSLCRQPDKLRAWKKVYKGYIGTTSQTHHSTDAWLFSCARHPVRHSLQYLLLLIDIRASGGGG